LLLGSIVSIGFQVIDLVPPFHIRLRGLDPALLFTEVGPFDRGGAALQLAIGVTAFTLWVLAMRHAGMLTYSSDRAGE
jgi:hypothetical protein